MIDYDRDQIEQDMEMEMDSRESRHLDDAPADEAENRQGRPVRREATRRQSELPSPLYRLKILHSNETFFGYWLPEGKQAHFRSMAELGEALEGPLHGTDCPTSSTPPEPPAGLDSVPEPQFVQDSEEHGAPEQLAEEMIGEEPNDVLSTAPPSIVVEEEVPAVSSLDIAAAEALNSPAFAPVPEHSIVVAQTRYGRDLCEVQGVVQDLSVVNPDEVVGIEKPACLDEYRKHRSNLEKEAKAYEVCRLKIWARNLPMKLVSAHYMLDEPKILFYFSAESRVDFRELVKDLVSVFKMRIELRQIGVRDEARVTGGCGVCGRILCCNGVSDKLNPVSIKMAKDQNLSLNSLKISGPCGRLLCCLSYEYQFYRDARRELPPEGARFLHDGTQFRVVEVSPLTGSVKMSGEDGRLLDLKADRFKMFEGRWQIKD